MNIFEQNKWIIALVIVVALIGVGYVAVNRINSGAAPVTTLSPKPEDPGTKILGKLEPCPAGKFNDLELKESNSQMYDVLNGVADVKPNAIHLYGIVKNNSKDCAVKSISMKITLSSKGQVLQEQTLNLLGEVKYPAFAFQRQATKEYKVDITVFESLLVKTVGSTKLRSDVVKSQKITAVEWVMPPQTNSEFIEYKVKNGDTIFNIAQNYHTDFATLATLNNLSSPYNLKIGQILKIPQ